MPAYWDGKNRIGVTAGSVEAATQIASLNGWVPPFQFIEVRSDADLPIVIPHDQPYIHGGLWYPNRNLDALGSALYEEFQRAIRKTDRGLIAQAPLPPTLQTHSDLPTDNLFASHIFARQIAESYRSQFTPVFGWYGMHRSGMVVFRAQTVLFNQTSHSLVDYFCPSEWRDKPFIRHPTERGDYLAWVDEGGITELERKLNPDIPSHRTRIVKWADLKDRARILYRRRSSAKKLDRAERAKTFSSFGHRAAEEWIAKNAGCTIVRGWLYERIYVSNKLTEVRFHPHCVVSCPSESGELILDPQDHGEGRDMQFIRHTGSEAEYTFDLSTLSLKAAELLAIDYGSP